MSPGFANIAGCQACGKITYVNAFGFCKKCWITYAHVQENEKMIKTIRAEFKLCGTKEEIERGKARIASLLACEEIISLFIKEVKKEKWERK